MEFPVFPLNGAILFPGTNLPLNIFEKRYIAMINYAFSNKRLIGMIQTNKNNKFFNIGCLGKITNFTESPDGKYQINLEGLTRYKIKKIIKDKHKFFKVKAEIASYNNTLTNENNSLNKELLSKFNKYINIKKIKFSTSEFENLDTPNLVKIICVISPLDYLIKQMLLEFDNINDLCNSLLSVLEVEINNMESNFKIN